MKNPPKILAPDSECWIAFCNCLSSRLETHRCNAVDATQAAYVLRRVFHDFDLDETLKFFREHDGFCDCEILMNVGNSFARHEEKGDALRSN